MGVGFCFGRVCGRSELGLVMARNGEAIHLANYIAEEVGETPCMNYPDLFFPDDHHAIAEAKELCRGCPVLLQCAKYALDNFEYDGIWGGLTGKERKQLWRKAGINYAKYERD